MSEDLLIARTILHLLFRVLPYNGN
jgi:hypothetical protein